ncbi:MAG: hypothetical protein U1E26_12795 [Coriobacteriia bacterium]|nr:hypothetical protein [bacterium]MDZ4170510.1 hypothetical protein [Coriobacteriia bacterium]
MAPTIPIGELATWNALWAGVKALFDGVGIPLMRDTYLGYLIIALMLIGISRFLWGWAKKGW